MLEERPGESRKKDNQWQKNDGRNGELTSRQAALVVGLLAHQRIKRTYRYDYQLKNYNLLLFERQLNGQSFIRAFGNIV